MRVEEWVNKEHLQKGWLKTASAKYRDAKPYPHIVIKDFLRKEKFKELEDALLEQGFERKESDLFSFSQTIDLVSSDMKVIAEFAELLNSREFREWIDEVTGVLSYHGKLDMFGAAYAPTDYLICHDDQLDSRLLAYVFYVSTMNKGQGGRLIMYSDRAKHPDKPVKAYAPEKNSLVLFTVSPRSWHEVEEVRDSQRLSLTGWYYE